MKGDMVFQNVIQLIVKFRTKQSTVFPINSVVTLVENSILNLHEKYSAFTNKMSLVPRFRTPEKLPC